MEKNGYLTKKMFMWIMVIIIGVITAVLGYTTVKVDDIGEKFNHNLTEVTNSISSINTSLEFIKEDLKELKNSHTHDISSN